MVTSGKHFKEWTFKILNLKFGIVVGNFAFLNFLNSVILELCFIHYNVRKLLLNAVCWQFDCFFEDIPVEL